MIDVNSPYFLLFLIFIPLSVFSIWMFYIWYYRGLSINKKFNTITSEWEIKGDFEKSKFNNCGKFSVARHRFDTCAAIYSQYCVNGTRYIWYLAIKLNCGKLSGVQDGVYGRGHAVDYCLETTGLDKLYKRDALKTEGGLPDGWSFVEIVDSTWFAFYRLPDFLGYGILCPTINILNDSNNNDFL